MTLNARTCQITQVMWQSNQTLLCTQLNR